MYLIFHWMKGGFPMSEKYDFLIDKITEIRAKNNKCWMAILHLAFKHAPKEAGLLMQQIGKKDKEISKLTKELAKIK